MVNRVYFLNESKSTYNFYLLFQSLAFTHAFTGERIFGIGFCGRLCDNFLDPDQRDKYDSLIKSVKQHRPYFTYWYFSISVT
jgi:hypothetical protein